jgi:COP9 signalosome complex subunit 2
MILSDPFIAGYLDEMLRSVRLNMLIAKIKPYKSVRIEFLAHELNISANDVMSLLIELILDGKVQGVIDQIKGLLELAGEKGTEDMTRRHKAMQKWTNCLRAIHGSLLDKVKG